MFVSRFSYKVKKLAYGCLITFLTVYIMTILAFMATSSHRSSKPTTLPRLVASNYKWLQRKCSQTIPLKQDASKNPLLTFYGHNELLKNPEVFRPSSKILTSLDYQFTISSPEACPANSKPTLFIMVLTQHEHYVNRKVIRETWGQIAKNKPWPGRKLHGDVGMIFLLGESNNETLNTKVRKEAAIYKDIVQANFQESYFNLTLKVLMGMKWVRTFCPKPEFLMKMDEDTFADIPRILNILISTKMPNIIYGPFSHSEHVVRPWKGNTRSTIGKAAVAKDAYPLNWYPPHVKGNMYVMPSDLAMKILNVSQYFPYVNIEDAHITGILAKVFDARHISIPDELYEKFPQKDPNLCDFVFERRIVAQGIYPALMYNIWHRYELTQLCGIISIENILNDYRNRKDVVDNMHMQRDLNHLKTSQYNNKVHTFKQQSKTIQTVNHTSKYPQKQFLQNSVISE